MLQFEMFGETLPAGRAKDEVGVDPARAGGHAVAKGKEAAKEAKPLALGEAVDPRRRTRDFVLPAFSEDSGTRIFLKSSQVRSSGLLERADSLCSVSTNMIIQMRSQNLGKLT